VGGWGHMSHNALLLLPPPLLLLLLPPPPLLLLHLELQILELFSHAPISVRQLLIRHAIPAGAGGCIVTCHTSFCVTCHVSRVTCHNMLSLRTSCRCRGIGS
jgi:hypothetical protein